MHRVLMALTIGFILGMLWEPVRAQVAERLFATLSTNLTTGTPTPLVCTAAGAGCYLVVQGH